MNQHDPQHGTGGQVACLAKALASLECDNCVPFLSRLDLAPDRPYAVLVWLPSSTPLDLRAPNALRTGLVHTLLASLLPGARHGLGHSKLGHFLLFWVSGNQQGVSSLTGETSGQAVSMVMGGWGLVPLLSSFSDGHLETPAEVSITREPAIVAGRAVVIAAQITVAQLTSLRQAMADLVAAPDHPLHNYGILLSPERKDGAGCVSLGLYLAEKAGVLPGLAKALHRKIAIHDGLMGKGASLPDGVRLWQPDHMLHDAEANLPIRKLLLHSWDSGPTLTHVAIPDGEALLVAMAQLRMGLVDAEDWRLQRAAAYDDPKSRAVAALVRNWASSYPIWRIADPQGTSALVLEHQKG